MAVDPAQIDLSPEQRVRLARLAEQTGRDWAELVDHLLNSVPIAPESTRPNIERLRSKTLFEVLTERGILGCFDGPTDLSTNPKHMEGFGEPRQSKNSH